MFTASSRTRHTRSPITFNGGDHEQADSGEDGGVVMSARRGRTLTPDRPQISRLLVQRCEAAEVDQGIASGDSQRINPHITERAVTTGYTGLMPFIG
jgi:hypothetical protein